MSETIESQRLECVCGKKLRIPANASAKAKAGKCPKCQAPFEFRDGEWVCVAVSNTASMAPEPKQGLPDEPLAANVASLAEQRIEAGDVPPTMSPVAAEPQHQDGKPLSQDASAEPAIRAGLTDVTETHAEQQEADVNDEVKQSGQDLEAAYAGPPSFKPPPVPEDTFSKPAVGSEVDERHVPESDQADPSYLEDDAANATSGFATRREDLIEPSDAEVSLPERLEREQTSLDQAECETATEPSTAEPSCESNGYVHVSPPASTESHERDRLAHSVSDSFTPTIAPELADGDCFEEDPSSQPPIDIPTIDSQTVADDVHAEQAYSCIVESSLVDEGIGEEPGRINQMIRASLATSLGLDSHYPEHVVAAITLACHPWPDAAISQNDIDNIAAELRPGFNINHPSMLEIAVDRLLRFEDALQFTGSSELAASYATAALTIESYSGANAGDRRHVGPNNENMVLIASPIGLGVSNHKSFSIPENDSTEDGDDEWQSTIISLLGSAVFRGSRDTGIALGSEETGVSVSRLAERLGVELPEKQFDEYLDKLDDRVLDILASRTFKLGLSDTLVDIAARWKITRERVRQIETKASEKLRDRFTATFQRLGKQSISPLSCHVFRIDVLYAIATRIAGYSRHREILSGFLADIFGPWQKAGHWIFHQSLQDRVEQLRSSLNERADAYWVIDSESIETECEGLFLSDSERDQFLREEFGFGHCLGTWTSKNTIRCQVTAALRRIGRPATKEELAELLEHPPHSVGSILGNIEGVVRADRYRWGFAEWIDDAYDGIYGEIEQRINEYSGSVPVHVLMSEIPAQFDVAENSVKAYLASSAFVVENGMVRMAGDDEYVTRSPSKCADAIRLGEQWGYRSLIHDRHFNGYSLGVNFDVAFANGLRPGDNLVVPVDGSTSQVSLIWRSHNLNRLVDVGRVTEYLVENKYKAGETLILIPCREKIEIVHERDLYQRFPELALQPQVDAPGEAENPDDSQRNGEVRDPLLDLLGGDQ